LKLNHDFILRIKLGFKHNFGQNYGTKTQTRDKITLAHCVLL